MCCNNEFLNKIDLLSEDRKQKIKNAPDSAVIVGNVYYVSADGNDENDGLSPQTAWKTLDRVSYAQLNEGDGVRFRRGDIFRGMLRAQAGVTYTAYGVGEKPRFYGWDKSLADAGLWELADKEHNIWKMAEPILDCGTLVFNEGEAHSRKLIPSYIGGKFVCRDDESKDFDMKAEMTEDLDIYWHYDEVLTEEPSRGENFPVPVVESKNYGTLYLRCDKGNPADVFSSVEALTKRHMILVKSNKNVHIDNLCLKYIGAHAVAAGGSCVAGLKVTNCEIGWIGGTIQNYLGLDPNFPEGGRGTVTRYGNGIEIYGGCDDYLVQNCYIYQVYDAGITHQVSTWGKKYEMKNIRYIDNLVEYCVYSIEYFLEKNGGDTESFIDNCVIEGNILRFSGYGWGQQRHNKTTPAHIKGWSYENTASNFIIRKNIFDRAAYRMVHLVAKKQESLPRMCENTYIQKAGLPLGQYGANEVEEPPILSFDEDAEKKIAEIFNDENAKVYSL